MNVYELTKKLISLQSYDDGDLYESPVTNFLIKYITKNFPWLHVSSQKVAPNRYNLLLQDASPVRLLFIDHLDTVKPSAGWNTDPIKGITLNEKIFGLGASDSKGNIAAFIKALEAVGETSGLGVLFYIDEEYEFAGMKTFMKSPLAKKINPETIISIDGNGQAFGQGCRGLIEFDLELHSNTGHSANATTPGVIKSFTETYSLFTSWLETRGSKILGTPTVNIGFLKAGLLRDGKITASGNQIANILKAKIEIRSTEDIDLYTVIEQWQSQLKTFKGQNAIFTPIHNLRGYSTSDNNCTQIRKAITSQTKMLTHLDPSTFGYLDIAMLQKTYPKASLCSFGIGEPNVNHKPNEFVRKSSLDNGVNVYTSILNVTVRRRT